MNYQDIAKAMFELSDQQLGMLTIFSAGMDADQHADFFPLVVLDYANSEKISLNADAAGIQSDLAILQCRDPNSRGVTLRGFRDALNVLPGNCLKQDAIVSVGVSPFVEFHYVDALTMASNKDVAAAAVGQGLADDQPIILFKTEQISDAYSQIIGAMHCLEGKEHPDAIAKCVLKLLGDLRGQQLQEALQFVSTVS